MELIIRSFYVRFKVLRFPFPPIPRLALTHFCLDAPSQDSPPPHDVVTSTAALFHMKLQAACFVCTRRGRGVVSRVWSLSKTRFVENVWACTEHRVQAGFDNRGLKIGSCPTVRLRRHEAGWTCGGGTTKGAARVWFLCCSYSTGRL